MHEGVVLVTGGSRGIGRACVEDLALHGRTVIFTYRNRESEARDVADAVAAAGGTARAIRSDASYEDDVRSLFRTIRTDHGPLSSVVSNAGITKDVFTPMMSLRTWHEVIDANLTSSFLIARESLKTMRRSGGSIVFMSSISGLRGQLGQANYSASKGGLNALTRSIAREGASVGVRANAVAPGFTDTDMVRRMPRDARERITELIPQNRLGTVGEIASVVRFLLGPGASYMTGQVVAVDGGLTI